MGDVFALAAVLGVALVGAAAAEAAVGGGSLGSVFSTPQAGKKEKKIRKHLEGETF